MDKERRYFSSKVSFETREGVVDENVIEGYAAMFNKDSQDFGGWIERIAPGAFDEVMGDDAMALFNHEANFVLGRNGVNVKLTQDEVGLKYRIALPDTQVAKDLRTLIKDGIIDKSSFAFTVKEDVWARAKDKESPAIRTVKKMRRLYDVSPVTYPAYQDTSVAARSFAEIKKENPVIDRSLYIKIQQSILQSQLK